MASSQRDSAARRARSASATSACDARVAAAAASNPATSVASAVPRRWEPVTVLICGILFLAHSASLQRRLHFHQPERCGCAPMRRSKVETFARMILNCGHISWRQSSKLAGMRIYRGPGKWLSAPAAPASPASSCCARVARSAAAASPSATASASAAAAACAPPQRRRHMCKPAGAPPSLQSPGA